MIKETRHTVSSIDDDQVINEKYSTKSIIEERRESGRESDLLENVDLLEVALNRVKKKPN